MKSGKAATTIWTRQRAQAMVLIVLLVALGLGWYESREISPEDIPLANLPKQAGPWQTVSEEIRMSKANDYKLLTRTYQDGSGHNVHVRIQATYTRLGALRDWSLASMASGWSVEDQSIWKSGGGGTGLPTEARIQKLANSERYRIALSWYTSAGYQAATLQSAELKGWRDRLFGGKEPWASMYLLAEMDSEPGAREAVKQLAQQLAPALRQLMCAIHP